MAAEAEAELLKWLSAAQLEERRRERSCCRSLSCCWSSETRSSFCRRHRGEGQACEAEGESPHHRWHGYVEGHVEPKWCDGAPLCCHQPIMPLASPDGQSRTHSLYSGFMAEDVLGEGPLLPTLKLEAAN